MKRNATKTDLVTSVEPGFRGRTREHEQLVAAARRVRHESLTENLAMEATVAGGLEDDRGVRDRDR